MMVKISYSWFVFLLLSAQPITVDTLFQKYLTQEGPVILIYSAVQNAIIGIILNSDMGMMLIFLTPISDPTL